MANVANKYWILCTINKYHTLCLYPTATYQAAPQVNGLNQVHVYNDVVNLFGENMHITQNNAKDRLLAPKHVNK